MSAQSARKLASSQPFHFRHVVDKEIPIELGLLCDLTDIICGILVLTARLAVPSVGLHGLILPRSWCLQLSDVFRGSVPQVVPLLRHYFLEAMGTLLKRVDGHSGAPELE